MTTHRVVVAVDRPPLTSNDQRRSHWSKVREAKQAAEQLVFFSAKSCGLPKPLPPSHVSVMWFAPDRRRRDADCLAPFVKAVLDSLVTYGCWPDDNSEHVLSTGMSVVHDGSGPRIEILITPECAGFGDVDVAQAEPAGNWGADEWWLKKVRG
ncbi:hypothetical protein [Mycobacterium sp. CnD-18-1]|uniref:hypothetical protein n=1 Tax=Mycobacterium sp. CnD-18-1 TaxID=2917744 RepID=UPI001EF16195|nr:hypothetical protein [Mycobacterium sp. CnD-18-1]MCG7610372.1 hypothetical protein [Mycobacterium sp. CnD-18-1]